MSDLTESLPPFLFADGDGDADPDLLAGLLASLLRAETVRNGQAFCHVALFAYTLRGTYAAHEARLPRRPDPHSNARPAASERRRPSGFHTSGAWISRNLRHLVREYALATGLPDHRLDDALAFSARLWDSLHPDTRVGR